MIESRMVGDVRITRIHEYSGPTHLPSFLLPDLTPDMLKSNENWMAPHHWIPHMGKLILTVQLWVVHAGDAIIVVDTGVGNRKPREGMARMHQLNTLVPEWLEAAGAHPDKVTHVVLTHLHMDHVGWNTRWADNRWTPTFPNARYYLPKDDFDWCASGRNKVEGVDVFGASFDDSVMPIVNEGLAVMMQPGQEIANCLQVESAAGHSPGQVSLRIRSKGEEAIFCGDIVHNPIQIVEPMINSGYCLWPDMARKTRHDFLASAADNNALILPVHFGDPYSGFVRREGNGYRFEPLVW